MVITIEDLQRRFAEYNRLYFRGRLSTPTFVIGKWSYGGIYGSYRHDKSGGPLISIRDTKSLRWNEEKLRNTLVHEMLHQYMDRGWFLDLDSSLHLLCWQTLRLWLNLRYGLHIHTWGEGKERKSRKKTRC